MRRSPGFGARWSRHAPLPSVVRRAKWFLNPTPTRSPTVLRSTLIPSKASQLPSWSAASVGSPMIECVTFAPRSRWRWTVPADMSTQTAFRELSSEGVRTTPGESSAATAGACPTVVGGGCGYLRFSAWRLRPCEGPKLGAPVGGGPVVVVPGPHPGAAQDNSRTYYWSATSLFGWRRPGVCLTRVWPAATGECRSCWSARW
jgi:hypothetical protein